MYCSVIYSVPGPDLEKRGGGGGDGGRSSRLLEKRGVSRQNFFSALRALVWSKNKEGAQAPPAPPPESATVISEGLPELV